MERLFARWPHAISATREFADSLNFSLNELRYEYPRETVPEGRSPQEHLEHLTWEGARKFWGDKIPYKVLTQLNHELRLIAKLDFARYFLTVHDIVAFARSLDPPILCQGRGSAANSAVCYCLGITAVDPATSNLLFERFISEERKEPPDIDVDFEHERREEVIQHIYQKYGRDRAGIAATIIHYRPRSAVREVGKVMGLSEDVCAAIASNYWGSMEAEVAEERAKDAGLNLDDPHLKRTMMLAKQLIGMPRHLSQHVGGFILTERPLTETVPIGNGAMDDRTFIEWDKDDIEELGILKIDVLALGMLTCIRKCFDLIDLHHGERFELATVPQEVPEVYDMLCKGDSLGVFQVESRAQMNMLPRLKPRCFYDLVIEVAIVRPGPIQGDMVHPFLKRRSGKEPVTFPCPDPDAWRAGRAGEDPRPNHGRPDLPGAGDEDRARCGEVQFRGGEPAAQGDGHVPVARKHRRASGQDGRADGRARLRSRLRPALLRPDQGLRRIWLPRKPRGELRAPRLRVELAEVEISGGVCVRAAQFAADGLLRAGADRPRCEGAWGRGAAGGCELQRLGLHAGAHARWASRSASRLPPGRRPAPGCGRAAGARSRIAALRQRRGLAGARRCARPRHPAAGGGRCVPVDGPRSPRGIMGRAGAEAGAGPAFVHRRRGAGRRCGAGACSPAGHAAQRACGERLSDRAAKPEGASACASCANIMPRRSSSLPTG